jgi:UDP-N-acetylmuramyl pentapeptide phosphotransferase/UDP-N-acetylglucosamine-1-phosphate transferase
MTYIMTHYYNSQEKMEKIDLTLYVISFLLGGTGAWVVVKWGIKLSLFDKPNLRSSHKTVTPKGGEIGILAAFLFAPSPFQFRKAFGFQRYSSLCLAFGGIILELHLKYVFCFSSPQEQFY